jgi:hypothetical protein
MNLIRNFHHKDEVIAKQDMLDYYYINKGDKISIDTINRDGGVVEYRDLIVIDIEKCIITSELTEDKKSITIENVYLESMSPDA